MYVCLTLKEELMDNSITSRIWIKMIWMTLIFGGVWIFVPFISNNFSVAPFTLFNGLKKILGVALIIFINVKFLLPNYYFKNKIALYLLLGTISIVLIYFALEFFINPLTEQYRVIPGRDRDRGRGGMLSYRNFNRMMPYFLAMIGSAVVEISNFANRQAKEAMLLKSEKLETEMKFLKSQINPHFLFNSLNNIYSLSYLKPEKTPENLLKLSEMLRYMLYECNEEKVPVSKEIAYLENFIHLKLLKDSRGMNVKTDFNKSIGHLMVAPMLLIPFVENAFKHSNIEDLENGWITIALDQEQDNLVFTVKNSNPNKSYTKDKAGGIGLPNVKRQLDLLYPNKHQLKIEETTNQYVVYLEIDLS